jgi:hypothetical protein
MNSINKIDIIGKWENDAVKYVFYKYDFIEIFLKHNQTSLEGEYIIDNDIISVKYGKEREMFWKGKINHITKTELSITDESSGVAIIDILYKEEEEEEVIISKSFKDNDKTPVAKKHFKALLGDVTSSVLVTVFFLALVGFFGYVFYEKFAVISTQNQSLVYGMLTFAVFVLVFFYFASKGSLGDLFDKTMNSFGFYFILIPVSIFIIVPIFIILVNILIFILTLWFFWYAIILLILLVFIWLLQMSIFKKILLTGLIILTIYFLFGAKDILRINFQPYFDKEKISIGNNSE